VGKKERLRLRLSKEGRGKEYQDIDTAGIASNTQIFHHVAVFVLLTSYQHPKQLSFFFPFILEHKNAPHPTLKIDTYPS